jgi:hypothetical protein
MLAFRPAVLLVLCLGATPAPPATSPDFCDPSLTYSRTDPYGYFPRPGRCEGRFRRRNTGERFIIAGYVSGSHAFSVSSARTVRLSWPEIGGDSVQIRAISLDPNVPYRMDTRAGGSFREFRWPTEVLRAVRLDGGELGLQATLRQGPREARHPVLVPLRIGDAADPAPRLVIHSVEALREVHLAIRDPRTRREAMPPVLAKKWVSGLQPVEIPIPPTLSPGRYRVEVSAVTMAGAHLTADAVILVPALPNAP